MCSLMFRCDHENEKKSKKFPEFQFLFKVKEIITVFEVYVNPSFLANSFLSTVNMLNLYYNKNVEY